MHPVLLRFSGYELRAAGFLYALAVVIAGAFAVRVARRRGWDRALIFPGLAAVVASTYLGARFLGALTSGEIATPADALALLTPGRLSFFGGLAAGSIAFVAFVKWQRLPIGEAADEMAGIVPLLYGLFRLGCLLNGDDYGPATMAPWGMAFPEGSPPTPVPVHPTPLYEILMMVPVAGWIGWRQRRGIPRGGLVFEVCILMGLERLIAEVWRLDPPVAAGLTVGQWFALVLTLFGTAGPVAIIRRRSRPYPRQP